MIIKDENSSLEYLLKNANAGEIEINNQYQVKITNPKGIPKTVPKIMEERGYYPFKIEPDYTIFQKTE